MKPMPMMCCMYPCHYVSGGPFIMHSNINKPSPLCHHRNEPNSCFQTWWNVKWFSKAPKQNHLLTCTASLGKSHVWQVDFCDFMVYYKIEEHAGTGEEYGWAAPHWRLDTVSSLRNVVPNTAYKSTCTRVQRHVSCASQSLTCIDPPTQWPPAALRCFCTAFPQIVWIQHTVEV